MDVMAICDAAEPPAAPAGQAPLIARLFSIDGRMTVTLLDLSADQAVATTQAPPPTGSIAVVARNSVRIPATVVSADGRRFTLTLDEPLDGRRREQFVALAAGKRRAATGVAAEAA